MVPSNIGYLIADYEYALSYNAKPLPESILTNYL